MKYAAVYGGIGGAIPILILSASLALNLSNHTTSVWFGYLVMLAALSLIFVGVKRFRDVECGGIIRFWRALGLGLAMALVAGIIYAAGWEIFIAVSGYDFMADYSRAMVEGMRAEGAAQAAIDAQLAELRQMQVWYDNPAIRVAMIFAEIFPVGLLVALVSAALLRNPRMLPATR